MDDFSAWIHDEFLVDEALIPNAFMPDEAPDKSNALEFCDPVDQLELKALYNQQDLEYGREYDMSDDVMFGGHGVGPAQTFDILEPSASLEFDRFWQSQTFINQSPNASTVMNGATMQTSASSNAARRPGTIGYNHASSNVFIEPIPSTQEAISAQSSLDTILTTSSGVFKSNNRHRKIPGTGVISFNVDKSRKGPRTEAQKKNKRQVKKAGGQCILCRMKKLKCSGEIPCMTCRQFMSKRGIKINSWQWACDVRMTYDKMRYFLPGMQENLDTNNSLRRFFESVRDERFQPIRALIRAGVHSIREHISFRSKVEDNLLMSLTTFLEATRWTLFFNLCDHSAQEYIISLRIRAVACILTMFDTYSIQMSDRSTPFVLLLGMASFYQNMKLMKGNHECELRMADQLKRALTCHIQILSSKVFFNSRPSLQEEVLNLTAIWLLEIPTPEGSISLSRLIGQIPKSLERGSYLAVSSLLMWRRPIFEHHDNKKGECSQVVNSRIFYLSMIGAIEPRFLQWFDYTPAEMLHDLLSSRCLFEINGKKHAILLEYEHLIQDSCSAIKVSKSLWDCFKANLSRLFVSVLEIFEALIHRQMIRCIVLDDRIFSSRMRKCVLYSLLTHTLSESFRSMAHRKSESSSKEIIYFLRTCQVLTWDIISMSYCIRFASLDFVEPEVVFNFKLTESIKSRCKFEIHDCRFQKLDHSDSRSKAQLSGCLWDYQLLSRRLLAKKVITKGISYYSRLFKSLCADLIRDEFSISIMRGDLKAADWKDEYEENADEVFEEIFVELPGLMEVLDSMSLYKLEESKL